MDKKLIFNGLAFILLHDHLVLMITGFFMKILRGDWSLWPVPPLFLLIYLLYLARKFPFLKLIYSECILLGIPWFVILK